MTRLVFIHGLGDDATAWDVVLAQPGMKPFDCVAVDVPGFGGRPFEGKSLEEVSAQLWSEVDTGVPTVLVGHSMGGVIVTLIAEAAPSHLLGIVNVEGNLAEKDTFFSHAIATARNFDRWFDLLKGSTFGRYGDALSRCDGKALRACANDLLRLSDRDQIGSQFRDLTLASLYVASIDRRDIVQNLLDDERVVTLEASHWVMEDQPVATAAHIACWAQEISAA